ncbi:MAG: pyridoxamine 5'-phosphate oxidase family protein [Chitinophagaceae bacterium]|nr:pyridoxamine 5'-phosphate oxidase family protein [Chitinophagaceae bacterium]
MQLPISEFLKSQSLTSIACLDEEGAPHSFTAYYYYDESKQRLLFKSSGTTRHEKYFRKNPKVSGTIHPDQISKLHLIGAQWRGEVNNPNDFSSVFEATAMFHTANPGAIMIPGLVWIITLEEVDFTDHHLGITPKLSWNRNAS